MLHLPRSAVALVAATTLVGACRASWPRDLGALPEDTTVVAHDPDLAYLARAVEADGEITVERLMRERRVTWTSAPDPTPVLNRMATAHAALPPLDDAVPLDVLVYNVALLDRTYAGTRVTSPFIAERLPWLETTLFDAEHDVILLQEVWSRADAERLGRAAVDAGYAWTAGSPDRHEEHGLFLAVRADQIVPGSLQATEVRFTAQRTLEWWPGPGIRRGFLVASFDLAATEQTVHAIDLHATSFPQFSRVRDLQARQVGRFLDHLPARDLVLVGGDFNAGPFYADDVWVDPTGRAQNGWWANARTWALWQHYGDLQDTFALAGLARDVERGRGLPEPTMADPTRPLGAEGPCAATPHDTHTGTDCNRLYAMQYGGTQFPARLDHLMIRDRDRLARVRAARIVHTDRMELGAPEPIEGSDHYGLRVRLDVARQRPEPVD